MTGALGAPAGRLLAGLGAHVVRPEQPDGDELRQRPPFATGDHRTRLDATGGESLAHLTYGANKDSVILDWTTERGLAQLRELVWASDITIWAREVELLARAGIDVDRFADEHPATALVLLTPFPPGSPFLGAPATDLTLSASGGFAWFCGAPDGPPEHPKGDIASTYASIGAALAGLVGLVARHLHGRAGVYRLSAQEAVAFSTAQHADPNPYVWKGELPDRRTWAALLLRGLQRCKDDRLVSFVMMGSRLPALMTWLSDAGVSDKFLEPEWQDNDYYNAHLDELKAAIGELCRLYTADEIVEQGLERLLMIMPVTTIEDLAVDPQLAFRDVFQPVADGPAGLRLPRPPMVFSRSRLPPPRRAPRPGEHDEARLASWHGRLSPTSPRPGSTAKLPLEGLRIADFTWMLAGPLSSRLLSDMGADVIRIESYARRDLTREVGPQPPGMHDLNTNSNQHQVGGNKRSIALDFRVDGAVDVARRIIASADVVLENYRPGTMAKWGLSPKELLAAWPRLVVVSMPAVGGTGPRSQLGAVGNGIAAYGGVNSLTGFPQNPPWGVGPIIGDFFAPLFTAQAVLSAYHHLQTTGEGQHVDCPMLESCLWLLDTAVPDLEVNGRAPARIGNRHEWYAPHGIFPCAGDDEWIAIAVTDDAQWPVLCTALGIDERACARFGAHAERRASQDEVEELLAAATSRHERWPLALALQQAGVPAAPVEHLVDHFEVDAGMHDRFHRVEHPYGPTFLVQNHFIHPDGVTLPQRRAPMIGEHSDDILRELGLPEDEIADLWVRGVIN